MDWKKEAINDLKNYLSRKNSILSMSEQIQMLDAKMERVKGFSADSPVMGGASKSEDVLINCIAEKDRLTTNIEIAKKQIAMVERGLTFLSDDERTVLTMFFINRPSNHIDRLCDELGYEKSRIYEIKDQALHKFTIAMYGIVDL